MYGYNKVGALFTAGTYPKLLRRLHPVRRCFSSRHRGRRPCGTRERKEILPEISRNTVRLTCESSASGRVCDVYLVGTNHCSMESCEQVKAVIEFLKPQAVFLELCVNRLGVVYPPEKEEGQTTLAALGTQWRRKGNFFEAFVGWSQAKTRNELQIPTNEFRTAYEVATKCGAKVFHGDRDIKITMAKVWNAMTLWEKTLLILSGHEYSRDTRVQKAMVDERDQYMSATLLNLARNYNSVVAVVGSAHLQGIKENWKKPVNLEELCMMPEKKRMTVGEKIVTSVGVAAVGIYGIYLLI